MQTRPTAARFADDCAAERGRDEGAAQPSPLGQSFRLNVTEMSPGLPARDSRARYRARNGTRDPHRG